MKKNTILFFCAAIALPLLLTSCHREQEDSGVEQQKKIKKIVTEYNDDGYDDITEEIWDWNGNYLSTITKHFYSYESGLLVYEDMEIAQFQYQNDKISTIRVGNWRYELSYQNDLLASVICYDLEGTPIREYFYEYDGTLLTKIKHVISSLSLLEEYSFEWLYGNVARIKYYTDGCYVSTYSFTYDNKENPFYNLCVNYYDIDDDDSFIESFLLPSSKNNVISGYHSQGAERNIIYTYDGDYPVSRRSYIYIPGPYDDKILNTYYEY